ncbi:hypothetical protein GCM10027589_09330 [Actinocorallia lasiicapitis]
MRNSLAALMAATTCAAGTAIGLFLAGGSGAPDDTPVKAGAPTPYVEDLPNDGDGLVTGIRDGSYEVKRFQDDLVSGLQEGVYLLAADVKPYDPAHPDKGGCTWQVAPDRASFVPAATSPMWHRPTGDRTTTILSPGNYFVSIGCGAWAYQTFT